MMRSSSVLFAALALFGCAHGDPSVFGSYEAYDMGMDRMNPPVTLEVSRSHRYRFCEAQRCVEDRWALEPVPAGGNGRIALKGKAFEDWVRKFSVAAYGDSDFDRQRGAQGSVELDFGPGPMGPQITLGAGDAAFVKR